MDKNNFQKAIGYTRSFSRTSDSSNVQVNLINNYCRRNDIYCERIYSDFAPFRTYRHIEYVQAASLGIPISKWDSFFPEWHSLVFRILSDEIDCILVDTALRLYSNEEQRDFMEYICIEHNVTIIEVCNNTLPTDARNSITLYHSSNTSCKRPCVVLKDVDELYFRASQLNNSWEPEIILDLDDSRKDNACLLQNKETIVVKSLFHLNRKILPVINLATKNNAMKIISITEGELKITPGKESTLLEKPLKVAIYNRNCSTYDETNTTLTMEILKAFVRLYTKWEIVHTYFDDTFGHRQGNWDTLVQNADTYDVILIDSFIKLDQNIHSLKKIFHQIQKPIFSLKEGEVQLYDGTNTCNLL